MSKPGLVQSLKTNLPIWWKESPPSVIVSILAILGAIPIIAQWVVS